jgi:hypothetical protein
MRITWLLWLAKLLASATNHNPPGSSITQSTGLNDLSKISNTNEQKESSNCKCLPLLHCLSCLAECKKNNMAPFDGWLYTSAVGNVKGSSNKYCFKLKTIQMVWLPLLLLNGAPYRSRSFKAFPDCETKHGNANLPAISRLSVSKIWEFALYTHFFCQNQSLWINVSH